MSDTIIKINPNKPSELEFEVSVQGSEDSDAPVVRIVVEGSKNFLSVFPCEQVADSKSKWIARLPKLTHIEASEVNFFVEVIVDGYYFQPASGVVHMLTNPTVQLSTQKKSTKPSVSTSFSVKQDKPVTESEYDDVVDPQKVEAQYSSDASPTNQLLTPEFDPARGSVKTGNASVLDQFVEPTTLDDLADVVTPGDDVQTAPDEPYDPKRVAESILKSTVGSVQAPTTKGTLFARDAVTGKPKIKGLDTPAERAAREANAKKVKDILSR